MKPLFELGVGDGAGSVLFAQVVRTSSVEERTSVLSMAMAARQIGLVLGAYTIVNDIIAKIEKSCSYTGVLAEK